MSERKVWNYMWAHRNECRDEMTGEINVTKLAESTCDALDGWNVDEVPELFYELAYEVAERDEDARKIREAQ